jgi:uncharacterized membrane protein YphA (DoxX/SURF4 family)
LWQHQAGHRPICRAQEIPPAPCPDRRRSFVVSSTPAHSRIIGIELGHALIRLSFDVAKLFEAFTRLPRMKHAPLVASILLGLLFIMSGVMVLFQLAPMPPLPEGSPEAMFMGAFLPTGYLTFVKVLEVVGGLLLLVPRTRNFGLLVLGPIIVNILAYHVFIMKGAGLVNPLLIGIVVLATYLLWCGRKAFAGLLN